MEAGPGMIDGWHGENYRVGTPSLHSPFAPGVINIAAAPPLRIWTVEHCSTTLQLSGLGRPAAWESVAGGARDTKRCRKRGRTPRPQAARPHATNGMPTE
jgi:hypothetical protein